MECRLEDLNEESLGRISTFFGLEDTDQKIIKQFKRVYSKDLTCHRYKSANLDKLEPISSIVDLTMEWMEHKLP